MLKFIKIYKHIVSELNKNKIDGNKQTGFEIPQFEGSLTDYSKCVVAGKEPKLNKNKQNRVDCPSSDVVKKKLIYSSCSSSLYTGICSIK